VEEKLLGRLPCRHQNICCPRKPKGYLSGRCPPHVLAQFRIVPAEASPTCMAVALLPKGE
jgi:hypothetical protein